MLGLCDVSALLRGRMSVATLYIVLKVETVGSNCLADGLYFPHAQVQEYCEPHDPHYAQKLGKIFLLGVPMRKSV